MSHIYYCEKLNNGNKPSLKYEEMYRGKIERQIQTFEKFEENLKMRENMKEKKVEDQKTPCDLRDPLSFIVDSNG